MKELERTNNPVLLSWLTVVLEDTGIESIVLDTHASVLEGSAHANERRVMVADRDYSRARFLLDRLCPKAEPA